MSLKAPASSETVSGVPRSAISALTMLPNDTTTDLPSRPPTDPPCRYTWSVELATFILPALDSETSMRSSNVRASVCRAMSSAGAVPDAIRGATLSSVTPISLSSSPAKRLFKLSAVAPRSRSSRRPVCWAVLCPLCTSPSVSSRLGGIVSSTVAVRRLDGAVADAREWRLPPRGSSRYTYGVYIQCTASLNLRVSTPVLKSSHQYCSVGAALSWTIAKVCHHLPVWKALPE